VLAVVAGVWLTAGVAPAQDRPPVLFFSTEAKDEVDVAGAKELKPEPQVLKPWANATTVFHLYAGNPGDRERSFVVEVTGGGVAIKAPVGPIKKDQWKRVQLTKAPAPPPAPVPPPPPGTPPPEVPPPGVLLPAGAKFDVRLLDAEEQKPVVVDGKAVELKGVIVAVTRPVLKPTSLTAGLRNDGWAEVNLKFDVDPRAGKAESSQVKLSFPRFGNDGGLKLRDGVYTRTLEPKDKSVELSGLVSDFKSSLLAHVAVDGVERAFRFRGTPSKTGGQQLAELTSPSAVVLPVVPALAGYVLSKVATKPVAAFQVRVEVDNPPADATLRLRIQRDGDTGFEEVKLGGPRNDRVWLDAGDPKTQGLAFATRSTDWVYPLNLTDVRGTVTVTPVLDPKPANGEPTPLTLVVDDAPPEVKASDIRFTNLIENKQLVKGKPLHVSVTATDLETRVAKAVFLLGKPGEDGKPAPDAVKVSATRKQMADDHTSEWAAAVPLPPFEKRTQVSMWVSATDEAGNTALSDVKTIEVVEAPPPAAKPGKIAGTVTFGDRPQPGLTVTLEADGKPKGTAKTDPKGKFVFEKVPPGTYKVTTAKTDFSTGLSGAADVTVEPNQPEDKPAKAAIVLAKNKPK
jgi:hypothetical protein